jgi:hypothetical protein
MNNVKNRASFGKRVTKGTNYKDASKGKTCGVQEYQSKIESKENEKHNSHEEFQDLKEIYGKCLFVY